jgi:hypothetical protein
MNDVTPVAIHGDPMEVINDAAKLHELGMVPNVIGVPGFPASTALVCTNCGAWVHVDQPVVLRSPFLTEPCKGPANAHGPWRRDVIRHAAASDADPASP